MIAGRSSERAPGRDRPAAPRWYVVHSRPGKEAWTLANLERQGFRAFLPQIRRMVRHARQVREVRRPLFPRYLFVALDLGQDRWRAVRGTLGVSSLLMEGERPRAAPLGLVEAMIAATDAGGAQGNAQPILPGQVVRFLHGPFADRLARVVEMEDDERVRLLLEVLGCEREIRASARDVFPAQGLEQ